MSIAVHLFCVDLHDVFSHGTLPGISTCNVYRIYANTVEPI